MVSFSCETCNDVIKKPKLDAHKAQCSTSGFTCLDCNQTFAGTSYKAHNSCITEREKYEGGTAKGKKGKSSKANAGVVAPIAPIEPPAPIEPVAEMPIEEPPAKKQKKEKKEKKVKPAIEAEAAFYMDTAPDMAMVAQKEAAAVNGTSNGMTSGTSNGMSSSMNADRAQQVSVVPTPSYIPMSTGDGTKREGKGKKRKREEEEVENELPELDPTQIPLNTLHGRPRTPAEIKQQARAQRRKEAAAKREDRKRKREEKAARRKLEKREHIGRLEKVRDPDSPIARLYKFVALTTHDEARPMALDEIMPKAVAKLQQDLGGDPKEYEALFMSEVKILSQKGRMRFKI